MVEQTKEHVGLPEQTPVPNTERGKDEPETLEDILKEETSKAEIQEEGVQEEKASREVPKIEDKKKEEEKPPEKSPMVEDKEKKDPEKSPLSGRGVNLWLDDTILLAEISVYLNDEGRMILVTLLDVEDTLKEMSMTRKGVIGEFTIPDLPALEKYRTRAERWSPAAQQFTVNRGRIRRLLLRHHLKKLTVVGEEVKLEHDQGVLTPESERRVNKLHPSVLEVLMLKFERESSLI